MRKRALAVRREAGHQQTHSGDKGGSKGGGKTGKPKAKAKAKSKAATKPPGTVWPFFAKNGSCLKGANCDMVHSGYGCLNEQPLRSLGSAGVQARAPATDAKGAESLGGVPVAGSLPLQRAKLGG